jgi:hypothetical protein
MKKLTIRGLMGSVVLAAVLFSSRYYPSQTWTSSVTSLTIISMATGALLAFVRHGRSRTAWTGFSVFGWAYLVLGVGPRFDALDSPILTSLILKEIWFRIADARVVSTLSDPNIVSTFRNELNAFLQIGHCGFAILFGLFGAWLACFVSHDGRQ